MTQSPDMPVGGGFNYGKLLEREASDILKPSGSVDRRLIWTPKENQTWVRLLTGRPDLLPKLSEGQFFMRCGFHDFGGIRVECPREVWDMSDDQSIDRRCPFCEGLNEVFQQARLQGRDYSSMYENEKAWVSALGIKRRYAVPAFIRSEQELLSVWYNFGQKMLEKILGWLQSLDQNGRPMHGNILDWNSGKDILIVKNTNKGGYPNYDNSEIARDPSPVGDQNLVTTLWNEMPDLHAHLFSQLKSYDEMKKILDTHMHSPQPQTQQTTVQVNQQPPQQQQNQTPPEMPQNAPAVQPQTVAGVPPQSAPNAPNAAQIPGVANTAGVPGMNIAQPQGQPQGVAPMGQPPAAQPQPDINTQIMETMSRVNMQNQEAIAALGQWQSEGGRDLARLQQIAAQYPKQMQPLVNDVVQPPQQEQPSQQQTQPEVAQPVMPAEPQQPQGASYQEVESTEALLKQIDQETNR